MNRMVACASTSPSQYRCAAAALRLPTNDPVLLPRGPRPRGALATRGCSSTVAARRHAITLRLRSLTHALLRSAARRRWSCCPSHQPHHLSDPTSNTHPHAPPQVRRAKALELLSRGWPSHAPSPAYDPDHALVLCRLHGHRRGLLFLYDRMRLPREALQVRGRAKGGRVYVCVRAWQGGRLGCCLGSAGCAGMRQAWLCGA